MDDDLLFLPAVDAASLIRRRLLSPVDYMRAVLDAAERSRPRINAFVTIDHDGALAGARTAEAAVASGAPLGPLHGLPVSVKDLIDVAGMRTTHGSRIYADNVAASDGVVPARLKAAGAIVFGKTTTPEFGHKVLTDSRLHGVTRNPWNREHTSGGSSGGAAVSIALGLGPIAVSTDGAGSGRIPASCCGVYGLKATLGRVPHEQATDQFGQLTYLGIMARHPRDLGAGLSAMSKPHPADPWSVAAAARPFAWPPAGAVDPIAGRRITVIRRMAGGWLHPDVEARLDAAIAFLDARGAVIREIDGRDVDWKLDVARIILRANQIGRFSELLRTRRGDLDKSFVQTLEEAAAIDLPALRQALIDRTVAYRAVQLLFDDADLLLTPTVATPAPLAVQDQFAPLVVDGVARGDLRSAWYSYAIPFNMTGHPAINIPFGHASNGLPVGVHFVAPWFAEADLIALAGAFDAETGASGIYPPGFGPAA